MGLAPGPDILFVLTQSALYGARAGFATTCGLITGLFVHITAVSLGVAALFQKFGNGVQCAEIRGGRLSAVSGVALLPQRNLKGFAPEGAIPRIRHAVPERGDHEHHQPQGDAVLPCFSASVRRSRAGRPYGAGSLPLARCSSLPRCWSLVACHCLRDGSPGVSTVPSRGSCS